MKKTTKHILGTVGLATVGLMTAIAIGMEAASALEPEAGSDYSTSVELNVTVTSSEETNGKIQQPTHGSTVAHPEIPVEIVYGRTKEIHYYLQYEGGEPVELPASIFSGQESGVEKWTLDLSQLAHYFVDPSTIPGGHLFGKYTFTAVIHGDIDIEDTVEFEYRPVSIDNGAYEQGGVSTDDDGELVLHVDTDSVVATVKFELQDLDGNPVIGPDGQPIVLTYNAGEMNPLEIDLAALGIPQGEYRFRVTSYDASGAQVGGVYYLYVHFFAANLPQVPNTGGSIFAGLNLSRSDYLISGLIIFGLAAGIGFFILRRRSNHC